MNANAQQPYRIADIWHIFLIFLKRILLDIKLKLVLLSLQLKYTLATVFSAFKTSDPKVKLPKSHVHLHVAIGMVRPTMSIDVYEFILCMYKMCFASISDSHFVLVNFVTSVVFRCSSRKLLIRFRTFVCQFQSSEHRKNYRIQKSTCLSMLFGEKIAFFELVHFKKFVQWRNKQLLVSFCS